MDWIEKLDSSDWIAIINAIATLFLSFFVYRSTNRASEAAVETTKLTKETFILNKTLNESKDEENRKFKNSLKYQYVRILMKRSEDILIAIKHNNGAVIDKNLKSLEYKHNISPENLALCFDELDVKLVTDAWIVFERYLEDYFHYTYPGQTIKDLSTKNKESIDYFTRVLDLMIGKQKQIDH